MELGLSSDGWERKFNQISNLKFLVRATCALRDSALHGIEGNLDADVQFGKN